VPKFPDPPGVDAVSRIDPAVRTVAKGVTLARVYFTGGDHPTRWNEFRHYGPTNARFDHHVVDARDGPHTQHRSILYCATAADTCFAEIFQETRRINRTRRAPWLAVFVLARNLPLLDLTGSYPTRVGASMAINTGQRGRARAWARTFYDAYPTLNGLYYPSSMNGNEPAVALNDRARDCISAYPDFNRALADDALLDVLKHSAHRLGYGLL
jgi:RES domain